MSDFIPLSVPNLKGRELEYVTHAVETEWVSTGGPYVNDFENKIAEYVHAPAAVSCQNGTSGLHLSMLAVGVKAGDLVIVPTLTFIAAVNPVTYIGAEPVFLDCDDSLCMDPEKLKVFCEEECELKDAADLANGSSSNQKVLIHKASGKTVKAVVVVHIFGNMADMEKIMPIADKYGLRVIEDATEAIGTYYTDGIYKGKYAGTIGDIGVYSFNGNKIITTGGGGMVVSEDKEYLDHIKHLSTQAKSDELYYEHDEIGFNYRMTNLQAALGLAQLEQLEAFIKVKNDNKALYKKLLAGFGGELLENRDNIRSNCWFYAYMCKDSDERDRLISHLKEHNIQSRPIWGLISEQKPYKGAISYKIEKAKYYRDRVVNIPCSTNLSENEVEKVCEALKAFKG
ncbi:MAG: LegC family aminotransferase [Lachnospiraceae bacterium]|nr:LegC family aminotransferase [Lachnospiraceae bacterium]